MAEKQTKLIPEFMLTEKGQYRIFRFLAILGIKFNHKNSLGHTLLVQTQNIKTKYIEKNELAFDLVRYRYKLGKTYQKGKLVKDHEYQSKTLKFEIDTSNLKQEQIYRCLSPNNRSYILGNHTENNANTYNDYNFGSNYCYQYKIDKAIIIIPSSAVLLYYYMRSSSMKNAVLKGNYSVMYDYELSNISNPNDALLVLNKGYSLLDGPFIYRFITNPTAGKGFTDIFSYMNSVKSKNDTLSKNTDVIPIKALFPTKERFVIKIRFIELPEHSGDGHKIFYAQEILTDASTLNFEKLTISKIKRQEENKDNEEKSFVITRKNPKNTTGHTTNKTPSRSYSTRYLQEHEHETNLALLGKNIQYGTIEKIDTSDTQSLTKSVDKQMDLSFVRSEHNGDENTQGGSLEAYQKDKKTTIQRDPNFEIFKISIEYLENTGLVSDFEFEETYSDIPYTAMKNGNLYSRCSINGKVKQFTTCTFAFNNLQIVLVEVESESADFATWMLSSVEPVSDKQIWQILSRRYIDNEQISSLKEIYNNPQQVKLDIKKHPVVDLEGEIDETMLHSWSLTLLLKLAH